MTSDPGTGRLIIPWHNVDQEVVLADGTIGIGEGALRAAFRSKVKTGGYTPLNLATTINVHLLPFGLVDGFRTPDTTRKNMADADAVLIHCTDPRSELATFYINEAKARHCAYRLIISGNALDDTVRWLRTTKVPPNKPIRTLYCCGSSLSTPDAEEYMMGILDGWVIEGGR